MPEHLDEPVVKDSLCAVVGGRGLAGPRKRDQSRARVALKLDLDIDEGAELAKMTVEMEDGVHLDWDVPHGQHGAALVHLVEAQAYQGCALVGGAAPLDGGCGGRRRRRCDALAAL